MYIDTSSDMWLTVQPLPEETFQDFAARVTAGVVQLSPYKDEEYLQQLIISLWGNYVLANYDDVVIRLKRSCETYSGYQWTETWWLDWEIVAVISASLNGVESPETATAVEGDRFKVTKSDESQQLVFGWANIAINANGEYPLDWDGDVTDPDELEKAAYQFVLKYRETGEEHQGEAVGNLVESIMFTKEKQAALGIPEGSVPEGWWVGFHIEDSEVFKKVKDGTYEMFSVEGTAHRQPTGEEVN